MSSIECHFQLRVSRYFPRNHSLVALNWWEEALQRQEYTKGEAPHYAVSLNKGAFEGGLLTKNGQGCVGQGAEAKNLILGRGYPKKKKGKKGAGVGRKKSGGGRGMNPGGRGSRPPLSSPTLKDEIPTRLNYAESFYIVKETETSSIIDKKKKCQKESGTKETERCNHHKGRT